MTRQYINTHYNNKPTPSPEPDYMITDQQQLDDELDDYFNHKLIEYKIQPCGYKARASSSTNVLDSILENVEEEEYFFDDLKTLVKELNSVDKQKKKNIINNNIYDLNETDKLFDEMI